MVQPPTRRPADWLRELLARASTAEAAPITQLVIRHQRAGDGYSELVARIDELGGLVLDGADAGEFVRKVRGDSDYEYSESVPVEWKDSVLLYLLEERFTTTSAFRTWCEERGIPVTFESRP
jgi:hypothetical protein